VAVVQIRLCVGAGRVSTCIYEAVDAAERQRLFLHDTPHESICQATDCRGQRFSAVQDHNLLLKRSPSRGAPHLGFAPVKYHMLSRLSIQAPVGMEAGRATAYRAVASCSFTTVIGACGRGIMPRTSPGSEMTLWSQTAASRARSISREVSRQNETHAPPGADLPEGSVTACRLNWFTLRRRRVELFQEQRPTRVMSRELV